MSSSIKASKASAGQLISKEELYALSPTHRHKFKSQNKLALTLTEMREERCKQKPEQRERMGDMHTDNSCSSFRHIHGTGAFY